ncbi:peptidoglycan-binding domain-containing protein [Floridanema evergladense]|uniref:Peptidoglycan-binding domain-containing protein n=1 Tax=Floridaenema evergladense BLCC-F167 TaxID=3153639 RepID=A0ABV4WN65_9CYAN
MQLTEVTPGLKVINFETLTKDTQLAKEVQTNLTRLGLLDPPADGKFGQFSIQALKEFQFLMKISESGLGPQTSKALSEVAEAIPLNLGNDLASRFVKYMQSKKYFVAVGERCYNIVYLEGAEADGTPNQDTFNEWNDRRIVIEIASGTPKIVGNWLATTEPGDRYTYRPMNPKGAARIAFGQYKAWQVGTHGNSQPHEALVQCGTLGVHRDANKDGLRIGDAIDEGTSFGINQHWGYDLPKVGIASAGCLVGQSRKGHREFMALIKQDRRYQLNSGYVFLTTVIAGDDLAKS